MEEYYVVISTSYW